MLSESKRRLSPLQMEQMIIHLRSEMEKYRSKNEKYEKEFQKNRKEKNSILIEKIEQLQNELLEQRGESKMLKNWKDTIQSEFATYKESLEKIEKMIELEMQKGSEREERNRELEREIDALSEIMRAFTTNQNHFQTEYEKMKKEFDSEGTKKEFDEKLLEYKQLIEEQNEKIKSYQEQKSEELKQLQLQINEKENNYLSLTEALNLQKQEQNKLNEEINNLKNQLKKEEESNAHLNELLTKTNGKATEESAGQKGFRFSHEELKGKFSKPMNTKKMSKNQPPSTKMGTNLLGGKNTSPSSKNIYQLLKKSNSSQKETSFGLNPTGSQTTHSTVNPFRNIGK